MISDADVAPYEEDGAVCLRGAIPMEWIETLRAAIDADIASPGPMKRINSKPGEPGLSFLDSQLWQRPDSAAERGRYAGVATTFAMRSVSARSHRGSTVTVSSPAIRYVVLSEGLAALTIRPQTRR